MTTIKIISTFILIAFLSSCAGTSKITSLNESGNTSIEAGDYASALKIWEDEIISQESKNKLADGSIYTNAGKAALKLNQNEKALKYLETARNNGYKSADMYFYLAQGFRAIDNLSKEITALEQYKTNNPTGIQTKEINSRLFETYVESENWEKANVLWTEMGPEAINDIHLKANYILVNAGLNNTKTSLKLAAEVLKSDSKNIIALDWISHYYYWKAENSYLEEMGAYKKNRTNKQYAQLLKALKVINSDFKKSRDYFEKLYKIKPEKDYAKRLSNVYNRLDNKQKSDYYKSRSK